MPLLELERLLKEIFRDDGEELGWFGCTVLVDERWLFGDGLLGQGCKLASEYAGPSGILGTRRQVRGSVDETIFLVDLVGELMERDISTFRDASWSTQDMIPRKHHRSRAPGFAGTHFVARDRDISWDESNHGDRIG